MEPDYLDIQMERRRQIFFGAIIALVLVFSVIYYFWGSIINRGTFLIYMEPPFTVDFYERKEVFECTESPCKIVQPIGDKSFLISKEGYDTLFTSEEIKLWRTVERQINMKMNPHFAKVEEAPTETNIKYEFAIDPANQMQKLFNGEDVDQKAIVYFPKALAEPDAFGNDKMILVIDRADSSSIYKVDIKGKNKQPVGDIPQFKNLISGKWSNDGKFFIATMLRQQNLWMMNEDGVVEQTNLKSNIDLVIWRKDHEMILITGNATIVYDPVAKTQESISLEDSLTENPSKIISNDGGENIYVQAGEFFYKLILE